MSSNTENNILTNNIMRVGRTSKQQIREFYGFKRISKKMARDYGLDTVNDLWGLLKYQMNLIEPPKRKRRPKVEINLVIKQDSLDGFYSSLNLTDFDYKYWINFLRKNMNKINNKYIHITGHTLVENNDIQEIEDWNLNRYFSISNNEISQDLKTVIESPNGSGASNFIFNSNMYGGDIKITILSKVVASKYNQQYLDGNDNGLNYHCVLRPIIDYYQKLISKSKTTATQKKYQTIVNKIEGVRNKAGFYKEGLLKKYVNGLTKEDLNDLVDELPINIIINSPFYLYNKKKEPIFKATTTKKAYADKTFSYINSRLNHLDEVICNQNETIEATEEQMRILVTELKRDNIYHQYIKNRDEVPVAVFTTDYNFKLQDDSKIIIEDFEKINELENNKMFSTDIYNDYILNGVHYNETINFNYTKNIYKHIDMEKAYYNFSLNPLYDKNNSFLNRICRYSNKIPFEYAINNVGYYKIDNVDLSNCDSNTQKILNKLDCYTHGGTFPHIDLKLLHQLKVKFTIIDGVYGDNLDFKFTEDMKKKFKNGKECKSGISLYSSWSGQQNSMNDTSRYFISGTRKFLECIRAEMVQMGNDNDNGMFIDTITLEAHIRYKKDIVAHRSHITGYITSYQRTSTILQLLTLDYSQILRVVVDGIYYTGDDMTSTQLISSFRQQNQKIKANIAGNIFCSGLEMSTIKPFIKEDIEFKPYTTNKIFIGAGGSGKTTKNLRDKGLIKIGYLAHSNKLCRSMKKDYPNIFTCPYQWLLLDNPKLENLVLKQCNVLLIDEASTLNIYQIRKIKRICKGIHLIFMGDLTHQCEPVKPQQKDGETDEEYYKKYKYNIDDILKEFNEIEELKHIYRFEKCKKQRFRANLIREKMNKNIDINKIKEYCFKKYGKITHDELYKNVKYDDILLSSRHSEKDFHNKELSKILQPKYYIKKSSNEYSTGEIHFEKPKLTPSYYDIRYCYTIHSIQGETLKDNQNLYIDSSYLNCPRVLYTAISRAKYAHQIKFF